MKWIDVCIKNPAVVLVGMILVAVFGALALVELPRQLQPNVDTPSLSVTTQYPGVGPEEIEEQITKPLEEQFNTINGLKQITSISQEGESRITLEFEFGSDLNYFSFEVQKKIGLVQLPAEAQKPILRSGQAGAQAIPNLVFTVSSSLPEREFTGFCKDTLKPSILRVPGVGTAEFFGGAEREVQVVLDLARLKAHGLTIDAVRQKVASENVNIRAGSAWEGNRKYAVRTVGRMMDPMELSRILLTTGEAGAPIYLGDVAAILDGEKAPDSYSRVNGRPAILFLVYKKPGENVPRIIRDVLSEVKRLQEEYVGIDIRYSVIYSQAHYINAAIEMVKDNLELGALLAVLVLIVFLRDIRSIFVISVSIPLCLLGALFLMQRLGLTLNVLSLAGLAFGVGMVVDSSIVVLENIFRRYKEGLGAMESAHEGSKEVVLALLASTGTTLAVFVPIAIIKEQAGQLFVDLAYGIAFAVGLSFFVALGVIPMACSRMFARQNKNDKPSKKPLPLVPLVSGILDAVGERFTQGVTRLLTWLFQGPLRRLLFVGIIVAACGLSLMLLPGMEYLPNGDMNLIFGMIKIPKEMSLEKADRLVQEVEKSLQDNPDLNAVAGMAMLPDSQLFLTTHKEELDAKGKLIPRDVLPKLRQTVQTIPELQTVFFQMPIFSGAGANSTEIQVRGGDMEKLAQLCDKIAEKVQKEVPGVLFCERSIEIGKPELQIRIDRPKAAGLGLSVQDVGDTVETVISGRVVSKLYPGGKEVDIRLQSEHTNRQTIETLKETMIHSPYNVQIPLTSVAEVIETSGPTKIEHDDLQRSETITAYLDGSKPLGDTLKEIRQKVFTPFQAELPKGYSVRLTGSADDLDKTLSALSGAAAMAILLVYLIMVIQFGSFVKPFIILLSVPLAMLGGILGVFLTGVPFDVLTMLGFVILAGIVVNNAILIMDFTYADVRQGHRLPEALNRAVRLRIRPIFMSTTTSVLGMLPLAMGRGAGAELYKGLGVAVVGGLLVSTFFTLVCIPTLAVLFDDLAGLVSRRK